MYIMKEKWISLFPYLLFFFTFFSFYFFILQFLFSVFTVDLQETLEIRQIFENNVVNIISGVCEYPIIHGVRN